MYKFKFSIVMAVYNVELFLPSAIESIIHQNIGFKENVQLILVDDGSKDSSGKICDEYSLLYPENIMVIHKENGGVSSARNEGLKYIEGKYINFIDSDDELSSKALSAVYEFFEINYEKVDLVSIPIKFFDGREGNHRLNYKYRDGSRIIDLTKEYENIQLSISSSFIKYEDALNIVFDTHLKYSEDAKECIKILAKKKTLGVVSDVQYNYRRRTGGSELSAIQKSSLDKDWYLQTLQNFTEAVLNYMRLNYGEVPLFVQFTLMYELQFRFKGDYGTIISILDDNEVREYKEKIYGFLNVFEDSIILGQRNISRMLKIHLLGKKYRCNILEFNNDVSVPELEKLLKHEIILDFFRLVDKKAVFEFTCVHIVSSEELNTKVIIKCNDSIIECKYDEKRVVKYLCLGEVIATKLTYNVSFEIGIENIVEFYEYKNGIILERSKLVSGKFFPVMSKFVKSYFSVNDNVMFIKDDRIMIKKTNFLGKLMFEVDLLLEYIRLGNTGGIKAVFSRIGYHLIKPFYKKEIWLVSDRINKADDNGEAFFEYLNKNRLPVNSYFVIRKDSTDYGIVSKIGKVLGYSTLKHKFYHLLADKIISAAADEWVYYPFGSNEKYYRDILCKQKRVFLQHGINENDLSGWLNRYNKNLNMFVTTNYSEFSSIINGKYFYDESIVKLTGLARYDRLDDAREKIITIMPTWRSNLANKSKSVTYSVDGIKRYDISFKCTKYFRFYNELLNNELLLKNAKKKGYKIRFMPHPNIIEYINWFDRNDEVEFCSITTKYRDIFSTSSLVLTDYSSVAFDFAYLRKPVIYTQFDKDEFARNHIYSSSDLFDYENYGFGEVEYDMDSTVDRLIEYMEKGCKLKDKYRERIDEFFAFNDRNNCKRIYEAIKSLE